MTGPEVILKGAEWVLSAERAEGAPDAIYGAECMTCEAESGLVDDDPKPVEVWALEHTRQHGLAHSQFLVTTQKHWRVDPLRRGPESEPGPEGDAPTLVLARVKALPPVRRSHARPRGRWWPAVVRLMVTRAGRWVAAPVLTVAAVVVVLVTSVGPRHVSGGR